MTSHCIEVVVYKVKNAQTAAAARRAARPHIESLPGFLGWQAVTSADDSQTFTDIVTWRSLADAKSAGEKMMADPACAPFMAEIAEIVSMGHYV
jgi:heme-degrading monooxygenase HmoA